jgi:transcriptional regulator with XRE-family HTH domain
LHVFASTLQTVTTEGDPLAAFRARLRSCREELGLNYEQAAKRAGITGQRWRNIEIGHEIKSGVRIPANPRRSNLIKMARAVEIPVQEALQLAGMATLSTTESRQITEQPRNALKALINELSEERVRALLHVAQTMTDPHGSGSDYHTEVIETPVELPGQRDQLDNDNGDQPSLNPS